MTVHIAKIEVHLCNGSQENEDDREIGIQSRTSKRRGPPESVREQERQENGSPVDANRRHNREVTNAINKINAAMNLDFKILQNKTKHLKSVRGAYIVSTSSENSCRLQCILTINTLMTLAYMDLILNGEKRPPSFKKFPSCLYDEPPADPRLKRSRYLCGKLLERVIHLWAKETRLLEEIIQRRTGVCPRHHPDVALVKIHPHHHPNIALVAVCRQRRLHERSRSPRLPQPSNRCSSGSVQDEESTPPPATPSPKRVRRGRGATRRKR
ncbi:hypothetical protein M405DRAFT_884803 [Rhizopogon salebrosus TDB-379]|nr:hypothetical protein M405DRAFT_884803 [Rhizopogon salebrosus TDB-379]